MSEPERTPRRRPVPTWAIHSADGVRIAGGAASDWWDTARPADPEPAPIYSTDCTSCAPELASARMEPI